MADPKDAGLRMLLDKFVCVRLVQMYGVDLNKFQFDFVQTWAIFYMNADGTLYGRYGSRSAMQKGSMREISVEGLKDSIQGVLDFHEIYTKAPQAGLRQVAGKQTKYAPKWSRPEKIPTLAKNKVLAKKFTAHATTKNQRNHGVGCIHCHMVASSQLMSLRLSGEPIAEQLVWPYPMPSAVGLQMDPKKRSTVMRVYEGSAAAKAGVKAGDEILRFDGQTIFSTADMQWVLHNAPSEGELSLAVRRGEETKSIPLRLAKDWRRRLGDHRFTNLGICMQIAGFNGRPSGRNSLKRLAIAVGRVHRKRMVGIDLRRHDTIIAIDGNRETMNLGKLTEYLLGVKPGSEIALTRSRFGEEAPKTVRIKVN